jgi:hypothetical protein
MEKKKYYNKKKGGEAHIGREWDSDKSSTDSPTRTLPTSPSKKVFSSPTSTTKVSWPRIAKRRRYTLEILPNILLPMMRVALVKRMMICLLANLTIEQKKKINELIKTIGKNDEILECQEDLLVKENKNLLS